jgi:putative spermidine/putrescine transport system ATP-binding protein
MDVLTNVEYGLRVKKVPRTDRRDRALEALKTVRLSGYASRRPSQLSGGQRVALARALVNRPRVLLLDEPLGALDLKLRRAMQLELKQIQREVGIMFCFVTHDQEEALAMSDRIAVFDNGRIRQVSTPAELYERPANDFVAGFVGTSNLLTGAAAEAVTGRAGTISIRPERIHFTAEGGLGEPVRASGTVAAIAYLGPVTYYVIDLDSGGQLTVLRQNLHGSADEALAERGRRVDLGWDTRHLIDLTPPAAADGDAVPENTGAQERPAGVPTPTKERR